MSKTLPFAISMIAICLLPGEADAGLFNLLKRSHNKAKCCPPPACCQANAGDTVSQQVIRNEPENFMNCYVNVVVQSEHSETGMTCAEAWSGWVSAADCETAHAQALAIARGKIPEGCLETSNSCHSFPHEFCTTSMLGLKASASSGYKVTYKMCCCNGQLIDAPVFHHDLATAKWLAKSLACTIAKNECGGRVRWCRWEICQSPPVAPAPCCQ